MKLNIFMVLSINSSVSFFLKYDEIANDIGANRKTRGRLSPISHLQFTQGLLILLMEVHSDAHYN